MKCADAMLWQDCGYCGLYCPWLLLLTCSALAGRGLSEGSKGMEFHDVLCTKRDVANFFTMDVTLLCAIGEAKYKSTKD